MSRPTPKRFPQLGKRLMCALLSYQAGYTGVDKLLKQYAESKPEYEPLFDRIGFNLLSLLMRLQENDTRAALANLHRYADTQLIKVPRSEHVPPFLSLDQLASLRVQLEEAQPCEKHGHKKRLCTRI